MGIVIGIDPGVNFTGVVVFAGGNNSYGVSKIKLIKRAYRSLNENARHQANKLRVLTEYYSNTSPTIIVEMPRVYPRTDKNKVRPNDIVDLAFMAGVLSGASSSHTSNLELVYPKTWKGSVPKKQHNARILKKLPGFEKHLINSAIPKGQHEHVIDAAGIGLWYIERNK